MSAAGTEPGSGGPRRSRVARLARCASSALLAATMSIASPAQAASTQPAPGEPAPDAIGRTADDRPASLAQFRGKVVVLSFWASWCGPCLKELPILDGIQKSAGKAHLQVVAVNIEPVETFREVARRLEGFDLLVTHDRGRAGSKAYGVVGIPQMIVIDREGRVVRVHRGYESALDGIVAEINGALLAR